MKDLVQRYPLLKQLVSLEETAWINPNSAPLQEALPYVGLVKEDINDASARLKRFAPYLAQAFPDTVASHGIIESPLRTLVHLKHALEQQDRISILGRVMIKLDSHLPISGSIKARGGIYEVLTHAEHLAIKNNKLSLNDNYAKLNSEEFRQFFAQYRIAVGSTGNLGLSIGIISAKLGFNVTVHMSADARKWKKAKLREHGVNVVEYQSDYGVAVAQGRLEAENDPHCFFIDDEHSKTLFLGYSVAGQRLKQQFDQQGLKVDEQHPLFVYLPCGVGGGPGGVAFGLKLAFGDHVHCFFAEPTHSPCMLLGVHTGLHEKVCVQDIGIDNRTAADGLAVGRASGFVGRAMERMLDGFYTVSDETLFHQLKLLHQSEGIALEPSAVAGVRGPIIVSNNQQYLRHHRLTPSKMSNATHLIWATGGGMVPDSEMKQYLERETNHENNDAGR